MESRQTFKYVLTFEKDSMDILVNSNARKLAKNISKTIIFGERKLLNLDQNLDTIVAYIGVGPKYWNMINREELLELYKNTALFKMYIEKYFLTRKRKH